MLTASKSKPVTGKTLKTAGDTQEPTATLTTPKFWIGIGASAGGLEALRAFTRQLQGNLPVTYIVAQHMAPSQKSMLVDIIARETQLPVLTAKNRLKPQANTIYIAPPNTNVVIKDKRLRLLPPSDRPGAPKPSVNDFFESLAAEFNAQAIAIILSGTGSDGAKGIQAVRASGGVTIAQDEHTAKYTGMPTAAQKTGCVDLILSPEELGAQVHLLLETPRNLAALQREPLTGQAMERLNELLYLRTKVDFRHYKKATVQRRVERRMAATQSDNLADYVRIAGDSPEEVDELFKDLLITVTSFFRDPEEFTALARHIDRMVKSRAGESLRIWVVGVATGEEAYTIAIQFAEALGGLKSFAEANIQIFATDIDSEAISVARRGIYPEAALAAMSEERKAAWFEPLVGGYAVRKLLREKVVFSVHDVARDPPFLKLDMISCRNLLIYFKTELQARVFDRFHYALKDDALLLLGKAETVSASLALFRPAIPDKHIFFQKSSHRRSLAEHEPPDLRHSKKSKVKPQERAPIETDASASRLESLIMALGPNALLVGADARILKVYGELGDFAGLSEKSGLDNTAFSLLKEPWSQDVRVGTSIALRNKTVHEAIARPAPNRPGHLAKLIIYPMHDALTDENIALVTFRVWEEELPSPADSIIINELDSENAEGWKRLVDSLTQELKLAHANLQITSEELETSNEELQSLNEEMQSTNQELQSTNEELQSTNEELETSSEELQSTNEELSTVNDELQVNSRLLASINERQRCILDNVVTPMIVVDLRHRIVDASLSAAMIFGIPDDLTDPPLATCNLLEGFPPLERLVNEVMESRTRRDVQANTDVLSATLSISPYRAPDGELQGVIVQLADNTDSLQLAIAELELIFEHVPVAITLSDKNGQIVAANNNANQWSGLEEQTLVGLDAFNHLPENVAQSHQKFQAEALATGETKVSDSYLLEGAEIESKWLRTTYVPFTHGQSGDAMVLRMSEDLSREHEEEQRTQYFRTRMQLALEASDIAIWERQLDQDQGYWSDRFKAILGLPADFTPSNKAFMKRVHKDDHQNLANTIEAVSENGEPFSIRVRLQLDNGKLCWVTIRGHRIVDSEKGNKIIGTMVDDTELVTRMERLGTLNSQMELGEKLSQTGYWQVDLESQTLIWSDQVYRIHGLDPLSYKPEIDSSRNFYHPDDRERIVRVSEDAITKRQGFQFNARIRHASGEYRHVKSQGVVQRDATSGADRLFGVFMDVTESTKREQNLRDAHDELARSNEELSRFSYVCSHDMKEPVRLIETMSTLLLSESNEKQSEQTQDLLQRINTNTERLSAIIDGLLAYSRVEAKVATGTVDLKQVAHEIRDALALLIEEKNASLEIGDLPTLEGARVHFVQLIQNLVGNSLTYTNSKHPVVRISSKTNDQTLELVVEDNGPGIPKSARSSVFDVFSRLELDSHIEGTGLGLSICQRIAQQYRGSIECVDSNLGGAAFIIRLPLTEDLPV